MKGVKLINSKTSWWYFIFVFVLIIVFCILVVSLFHPKTNSILTDLISPVEYIKLNQFKEKYKPVKQNAPIFIFYHICPKSKDKQQHFDIIDEQINDIIQSGLYEKCETIFYGCSCTNCDTILNKHLSKFSKFKKLQGAIVPNKKSYENTTINSMLEFTKNYRGEFYGLYIHTKGITGVSEAQNDWRRTMMFFLVKNHELCIDILDRGFYTCGFNYLDILGYKHYGGNFFWFDSNYAKDLNYIENVENDRYTAEMFLLKKYTNGKHVSLYKERYMSFPYINAGLYSFDTNYDKNINNIDIAIV